MKDKDITRENNINQGAYDHYQEAFPSLPFETVYKRLGKDAKFEFDNDCYDFFIRLLCKIIYELDHHPSFEEAFSLLNSQISDNLTELVNSDHEINCSADFVQGWLERQIDKKVIICLRLVEGEYIDKWDAIYKGKLVLTSRGIANVEGEVPY
ncbi:hypothetical protein [Desulfofustis limnaeus]|uniref:Uncharacterized protein n=1 Tax=Desulfofustis limnaeus TaxID=2740163 RepID=A0ABM7WC25_9BACT|nr:hypothetical protein [Desulfofustis limnaeus]BDD88455.1 hypothetical protein DPPLL_28200 [Desulfofustis limnaeus]